MINMKIFILIFVMVCLVSTASATNYYISPTGDDSNDGLTIATARYNLSNMDTNVFSGPGHTIWVLNGSYHDSGTYIIREFYGRVGNLTHPMRIMAYNGSPEIYGDDANTYLQIGDQNDPNLNENVIIDGISFRNYSKILSAKRLGNFTMTNCTLYDVQPSQDSAQMGGFDSQYVTFSNNLIKGYIGYNSVNFIGPGNYFYIYNNTIQDVDNPSSHGALQIGINISNVHVYDNTMSRIPKSGGIALYNGQPYWWASDIFIHDNIINENSGGFSLLTAYNISIYNMSFDPKDSTTTTSHIIYIKGYPYFYATQDVTKRTHNVTLDNITISNFTGSANWSRVRVEGGDGITLSNFTLNDIDPIVYDFRFQGYTATLEATYPDLNKIQDTITNYYGVRIEPPVKIAINYTDNSVFDIATHASYPQGNRTSLYTPDYSSNLFWKYSGTEHMFYVTKYNYTVVPDTGILNISVNEINETTEKYNLTVNSSVAENPTWFNVTVQNTTNYSIKIDGVADDSVIAGDDYIVQWQYSEAENEWDTEHIILVEWSSGDGWEQSNNITYLNRLCTFYINNQTTIPTGAQSDDIIVPFWVGGS